MILTLEKHLEGVWLKEPVNRLKSLHPDLPVSVVAVDTSVIGLLPFDHSEMIQIAAQSTHVLGQKALFLWANGLIGLWW